MRISVWKNIIVLRGIAICAVVFAHAANLSFIPFLNTIETFTFSQNISEFTILFLIRSTSNIGIHVFVFATGFMVFRMFKNRKVTNKYALDLLKKYLIWAIPLTIIMAFWKNEVDIQTWLIGLLAGGPMPAYWFFILIILLLLISPFYINLVIRNIKHAIIFMVLLQIIVFIRFYYISPSFSFIIEKFIVRTLTFSPPFILGMIVSFKIKHIVDFLKPHKRIMPFLVVLSGLLCIFESLLLALLNDWKIDNIQRCFATNRISLMLFFIFTASYILLIEDKPRKITIWLSNIGISSFGIFLMTDFYNKVLQAGLWHFPVGLFLNTKTTLENISMLSNWLAVVSLWVLPIYIINGIYSPILTMKISKKLFGKKLDFLW